MIDHVCLNVSDLARSRAFYARALAPLGYAVLHEFPGALGLGEGQKPDLWLLVRPPLHTGVHVALTCTSHAQVDAFYREALAAGGEDHGPPGPRPQYHPNYYGAFVLDPDGNNLEAVCHKA